MLDGIRSLVFPCQWAGEEDARDLSGSPDRAMRILPSVRKGSFLYAGREKARAERNLLPRDTANSSLSTILTSASANRIPYAIRIHDVAFCAIIIEIIGIILEIG